MVLTVAELLPAGQLSGSDFSIFSPSSSVTSLTHMAMPANPPELNLGTNGATPKQETRA